MAISHYIDEQYREENMKLGKGWINCDEDISADEYIRRHASPEYLEWYERETEEIEELHRQNPNEIW